MCIWIDATDPRNQLRVFGMSLLERQLHAIIEADLTPAEVCIEIPAESPQAQALPPSVSQHPQTG